MGLTGHWACVRLGHAIGPRHDLSKIVMRSFSGSPSGLISENYLTKLLTRIMFFHVYFLAHSA